MSITTDDIKVMASQRLYDEADGGGYMTATEIVDGAINNLHSDISRLDRTMGRVSLRKWYLHVDTLDTDTYYGAHAIISERTADPGVGVVLIASDSDAETRSDAIDRLESYVARGPKYQGWLWGDHLEGSRAILLFQKKGLSLPKVGSVLYFIKDEGLSTEAYQYVRITKVESSVQDFTTTTSSTEYGEIAQSFNRTVVTLTISDPLRTTFPGIAITANDAVVGGAIYTTVVADASKYYGAMPVTEALASGAVVVNVGSIYSQIVPTSQGEAPMVDLSVGEAGPVVGSGISRSITVAAFPMSSGCTLYFGMGLKPGSLTVTHNGHTYTDTGGKGIVYEGATQMGTVDYSTGMISFAGVATATSTAIVTAIAGAESPRVNDTFFIDVELSNRGYNFTAMLNPVPAKGTLMVDYMAQGEWYRLREQAGNLVPDIAATGTGTVNLATGSVILTCAALPDVGSTIIFSWGSPLEVVDLAGDVTIDVAQIEHTVAEAPVKPGSMTISWISGGSTVTCTDNGSGILTGAATGTINYATGRILFEPTLLPSPQTTYEITYHRYPYITEAKPITTTVGIATATLSQTPIKPGTLNLRVMVGFAAGFGHIYELRDDGAGGLSAPGFSGFFAASTSGSEGGMTYGWNFILTPSLTTTTSSTSIQVSGLAGTIDYNTGAISLNVGAITGVKTVISEVYTVPEYNSSSATFTTPITSYNNATTNISGGETSELISTYSLSAAAEVAATETTPVKPVIIDLTRDISGKVLVPGSISFLLDGVRYIDRLGRIYRVASMITGMNVDAGSINYTTGVVTLDLYEGGTTAIAVTSMLGRFGHQFLSGCAFRTPGAPIRPGSVQIQGVASDGRAISGTTAFDGTISGALCRGYANFETGVVQVAFGELVDAIGNEAESWYDVALVDVNGQIFKPVPAFCETLTYACVVYSFIPLDADLLGLDPVRLPVDGRVVIVRSGDVVVVHNTQSLTLAPNPTPGLVYTLPRAADSVEIYDSTADMPLRIPSTMYAHEEGGTTITIDLVNNDFTAYTMPLTAMHKIEDMVLVSDTQINGQITLSRGVTKAYPLAGTMVSSALLFGDLRARQYNLFDQKTWTNVFSDDLIGDQANASYNEIDYPVVVTNRGCVTERWALVFDAADHFNLIGEKRGIVDSGYITQDFQPINLATGNPMFFMDYRGFGSGWAVGNVIRFNTTGAAPGAWSVRTTLQGPETEPDDHYTIQPRGDAR